MMSQLHLPDEEIDERGKAIYEQRLRPLVETAANLGKQIVIDVETGDYEIDHDGLAASRRLMAKHENASLYGLRIGYNAVYAIGGVLTPTARP